VKPLTGVDELADASDESAELDGADAAQGR